MYTNVLVRDSSSWNTTKKKTEGSWTRSRIIFFLIILFRMAVFWKLIFRLLWEGWARARASARAKARARARARAKARLGVGIELGLELGLGIYKFTEGYLYFRKYR